eukprot:c34799_g1_i1 orf=1-246(-)
MEALQGEGGLPSLGDLMDIDGRGIRSDLYKQTKSTTHLVAAANKSEENALCDTMLQPQAKRFHQEHPLCSNDLLQITIRLCA